MDQTPQRKKASKAPKKPSPEQERKRAYKELVALRRKTESTASELAAAERTLRSVRTNYADFKIRERSIAEAEEMVAEARTRHAEAVRDFEAARSRQ